MKVLFTLPTKKEIILNGRELKYKIGSEDKWTDSVLGKLSHKGGVYVFHTSKDILYVGKTFKEGSWGNFKERIRRHCQKKASRNSDVYKILKENSKSKKIFIFFLTSNDIKKITKFFDTSMSDNGLVLTCEQILIDILNPKYERNKIGYKNLIKGLEKKGIEQVKITFSEIEKIIGRKLPESSKHHTWWYPGNRPHADYWLKYNWRVKHCYPKKQEVIFECLI